MDEYNRRILKSIPQENRDRYLSDWYTSADRYIDFNFTKKSAEESQQDYILKRWKNRFKEAKGIKETETQNRKLKRLENSKRFRELLNSQNRKVKRANYNEKILKAIELKDIVRELKHTLTNELNEEAKKKGKNPDNANTKRGIKQRVDTKIVNLLGIHPDNIENKSLGHIVQLMYPNHEKPEKPSLAEQEKSDIFNTPDDQLDAISQKAKHDGTKWISVMQKVEEMRDRKKSGWSRLNENLPFDKEYGQ